MRRLAALTLALVVPVAMVTLPSPASAASTPKVTKFSATAGPLNKTVKVTLTGSNLHKASKARVGRASARISSKKSRSLVLTVPRSSRATTAKVQLYSARKWRTVGTWRYVARPSITSLSRSTGQILGGQSVVVQGKYLDRVTSVVVSGTKAKVTSKRSTSVTITTPPSVVGATTLQVNSPGGAASKTFTYDAPAPSAAASIKTVASTFEPSVGDIQWVIDSEDEGYIISLAPGASLPAVEDPFYLAAGTDVYPSGLAGKVESLAVQTDGSVRVVVRSVPLEEVFTELDVDVTKEIDLSSFESQSAPAPGARAATPSGSLGKAFRSAFRCSNDDSGDSDEDDPDSNFSGSLDLEISDVTPHFEDKGFGNPFVKNEFTAYISGKTNIKGSIKADKAIECDLKSSWQNSHRKVFNLGYGVTYSIAPEVHLSVSASGSVSITRSQSFLYGTHWKEDSGATKIQDAGTPQVTVQGKLAGSVSLEGGISNRLGLLDRVGIEVEGLAYLNGEASFTLGTTGKFCLQATYGLKAPVKLFLDYWYDENTTTLFTISRALGTFGKCGQVWGAVEVEAPQIITTALSDATVGTSYSETLHTADNRNGTWGTTSTLPPGLVLNPSDGTISGTPTAGVGTRILVITFEDADGDLASTQVLLKVKPSAGLGGGDIQATLTWNHAADMDLHALEPDGTEIYFGNSTSSTGGELDHDSNVGCGDDSLVAENIRWPADAAPSGTYYFAVQTYRACDVVDPTWHLVVRVDGQIVLDQTGSGTSDWIELSYGATARSISPAQKALPPMSVPDKD